MKRILFTTILIGLTFFVQPAKAQDKLLGTVGALSATALYDTYLVIGTLGDSWANENYEKDYIISLLNEQVGLADSMQATLEELEKSGELADPADREFVLHVVRVFDGLAYQAESLIIYINSGLQEDADEFEANRQENWAEISSILGIGE